MIVSLPAKTKASEAQQAEQGWHIISEDCLVTVLNISCKT